jgi:hypothetical protein
MQTVSVIVASITTKLNWIGNVQKLQAPFITRPSFLNVIYVIQSLKMFVCFAVELKVCLQVSFVAAQLTNEVATNYY